MPTAYKQTELVAGRSYLYLGDADGVERYRAAFDQIDTLIYDGEISDAITARQFVERAQLGAFGSKRLLVVKNADQMSEIVQNTLLKLLEEPPSSVVIVLQTQLPIQLLPTVLSRLHLLEGSAQAVSVSSSRFENPSAELFNELAALERERLIEVLAVETRSQLSQLLNRPNNQTANRIELLHLAANKLKQNANQKLTIDWLLLRWSDNRRYIY